MLISKASLDVITMTRWLHKLNQQTQHNYSVIKIIIR
jgi:hypothetical protein